MPTIKLPWPPSVNHYWCASGKRRYISEAGTIFRKRVQGECFLYNSKNNNALMFDNEARLSVLVEAYPPDRRKRDLDNILKAILDSLQHAQVFKDDNQIDKLSVWRCNSTQGCIVVTIDLC
jgi:crossover junction endodeoxyribonuclease RusA